MNSQISILNDKIAKANLQIQATNLTLAQLDQHINDTQAQITVTQSDIQNKKVAMGDLLQELYQTDGVSFVEIFLKDPHLSDFWNDTQSLTLSQANLQEAVTQVQDLQNTLQDQEQQFERRVRCGERGGLSAVAGR